ncbi:TIGR01777 family protein [Aestuariicella hydrocarbonica]|uniref:TIGR01777 family protein n=1 Tax=Pseudomaricurvus hydrocarbonicus TaxID=1470433 RepID=A0A9E5JVN4_9GAMM|nr:TIGR01777 family oxidoreductase [Aestuariicella hydrocarbonica]NHO65385.1 TIGR01777 family protein [Aestuariicella hydrocarbonica]
MHSSPEASGTSSAAMSEPGATSKPILASDTKANILITGGTGFIGPELVRALLSKGYSCWVLSRQAGGGMRSVAGANYISHLEELPETLPSLIVNLAGEGIADKRWSATRKRRLYRSRINVTEALVGYYREAGQAPSRVVSGSAVGYYGSHGDEMLNEEGRCHPGFAHSLCRDWELAAEGFQQLGAVLCCARIGVVIGADGGIVSRLKKPFQMGLGGRLGSGRQWMSWIHRQDLVDLLIFLLEHTTLQGPFNATSPNPVTNAEFTQLFAEQVGRAARLPMPEPIVKLLFGQMGEELLLSGQRVMPENIVRSGFEFTYPTLNLALGEALGGVA